MTKIQADIIARIKKNGGEVVSLNNGLYTMGGTYLAFTNSVMSTQVAAKTNFLEKFFTPFTDEETQKLLSLKQKRYEKYKRLINSSVALENFVAVEKLSHSALYYKNILSGNHFYTERYFRLKGDV